jgi:integrase
VASNVFEDVVKDFIELHAKKNQTWPETQRVFDRYVLPQWRYKSIKDIDKDAVTDLLDKIEKKQIKYKKRPKGKVKSLGGPLIASAALKQISKLFNWHAARSSDFTSPIVKGMDRGKAKARSLYLNDAELRVLWPLLDDVYGAVLKTALLSAQRFHKVSGMLRSDLKAQLTVPSHYNADKQWVEEVKIDNVWDAGRDDDPENKQVSAVPLSAMACKVIDAVPKLGGDYVFTIDGREPLANWNRRKKALDERMKEALREQGLEFREWQHRDLRRTAKVLMKRAGVSTDDSERCLAHVIGGVRGVYDRYDYLREKQDAFDRLAAQVERIVNPPSDNVVAMPQRAR